MKVSACICVRNQREHMVELLKLITGYVDEIIIVDGMSNDGTFEACSTFPVVIHQLPPKGPDADREYCIMQASNEWVLMLDADERPSHSLLKNLSTYTLSGCNGFWIARRNYYAPGKYYRHIHYPDYQLRLFKRRLAIITNQVHGAPFVVEPVIQLGSDVYIEHLDAIYSDKNKYKKYARVQAQEWSHRWPRPLYPLIAVYQATKDFLFALSQGCYLDGVVGLRAAVNRAYYTGMVYYQMTFTRT